MNNFHGRITDKQNIDALFKIKENRLKNGFLYKKLYLRRNVDSKSCDMQIIGDMINDWMKI